MTTFTQKETQLLAGLVRGMDEPGNGWAHEIVARMKERHEWNDASTGGVVASLVKKGAMTTTDMTDEGMPDCDWWQVTPVGEQVAA